MPSTSGGQSTGSVAFLQVIPIKLQRIFSYIIFSYILRSFCEARVLWVIGLATQGLTGEYHSFMLGYNEET